MRLARLGVLLIIAVCMAVGSASSVQAARGTHQTPKLLNLWLGGELSEAALAQLAQWDMVVMDMDEQGRSPDRIRRLRELNPRIKILAYVDSSNIGEGRFSTESHFPGYTLAHRIVEQWYVRKGGARASIWSYSWMLNVTNQSPTDAQGRRWNDVLPEFIQQEMWSTGLWDGFFLDNALDNATWFAGKGLDIDGDGVADPDAEVDRAWKEGWQILAKNLRARLGPSALIMGNGSEQHAGVTNGILFENFPRYGWTTGMRAYQTALRLNVPPSIASINGNANNVDTPWAYQTMRFALGSALLGDGYFSFDFGDRNHGQTWWYDEYDASLGAALGPPERFQPTGGTDMREGVWWRDYEHGAVMVNSLNAPATVSLPGVYERLRGSQDPSVNSGQLETSVTLPAQDALVLRRRLGESSLPAGTAFRSGDFVRVYRADGSQPRAGFFAQHTGATGGATVLVQDVDRDGTEDTLIAARGDIRITYGTGRTAIVRPFGAAYRGGLTLAVGNTDRDTPWEIVTGSDIGEVRVVELGGTVRAGWRPYASFRGSISVAIGDVDGDGLREIATGAGPGGGPHIRMFKTDGLPWRGGWFAFDARERGGVFVAIADMDGDGAGELITGSGERTIPRLRVWRAAKAELMRELILATNPANPGVRPSVTDLDADGIMEILASGIQVNP